METNVFTMPIGGKSILRSTGEEVEIIDVEIKESGARFDEGWVTHIDWQGAYQRTLEYPVLLQICSL